MVDSLSMSNIIFINSNFESCLKKLEKSKDKIVIVLSKDRKLLGTITDGDVRRYILVKKDNRKISEVMNKKPKYIRNQNELIIQNIKKKFPKINFLPIVDKNKKYLKYLNLGDESELKKTAVLIMAGGKGDRLKPITKKLPKPMLLINQKPLIINLLSILKSQGFENIFISVNYLHNKIILPVKKYSKENKIEVNFIKEKKFLGTAGSIGLVKRIYDNYLIINSDIVTSLDFKNLISFHINKRSDFTICTKSYENKIQFGVLNIKNNRIVGIKEKPTLHHDFCCGVYVLNNKILKYINKNKKIDMPQLIEKCSKKKVAVIPYMLHEYWKDIGNKESLLELNGFYSKYFI